jgi:hypothetical protein
MSGNGVTWLPGRRGRWAIGVAVALALVVCAAFAVVGKVRAHYRDVGLVMASVVPADVRAAQERTIAAHLEQHPDWAWMRETGGRVLCGVQELGERRDPHGRTRVYAWSSCRNEGGDLAHGGDQALIVMLTDGGAPTVIFQPGDGSQHAESIEGHFPRALWDAAFYADGVDKAALERQIDARRD